MTDLRELIERCEKATGCSTRLSGHHSRHAVKRSTLIKFFGNAFHFLNDNVGIKCCYAMRPPVQIEGVTVSDYHPFFLHFDCLLFCWQSLIEYTAIISTSGKFISENLDALALLRAMESRDAE